MLNRLSLFAWLVELESLDVPPDRQGALRDGYELAALVVADGLVANDNQARLVVARLLADLEIGDSLRRSIDAGLARSRYGVVVLSRAFFAKPWPPRELDGLFGRELVEGAEIILPLWHEIDQAFLANQAPMLLDRLALQTDIGIATLAERLSRRLRRAQGDDQLRVRTNSVASRFEALNGVEPVEGETAAVSGMGTRAQTIEMLRSDGTIGLRELLRQERRVFDTTASGR